MTPASARRTGSKTASSSGDASDESDWEEVEEDAEEEFYSYVTAVEDQTTKGLGTVVLDE